MTLAATVSADGIDAPNFEDILAWYNARFRSIYGVDIYIDPDSQDGQLISIYSTAVNDANNMARAIYAARSPADAQGAGLSSIVKINGIRRLVPSNSTAPFLCVGQQGVDISGLQIGDNLNLNTVWTLPGSPGDGTCVFGVSGELTLTGTCTVQGAIAAASGSLDVILTPTRGWDSATNTDDATPGAPVESDATLRRRQASSTSIPALTTVDALQGALENLAGVTRVLVYENDTGAPDANGLPAHSICAVIEGGDIQSIGALIALYKAPGCATFGTTTVNTFDPLGVPKVINFTLLSDIDINTLFYITEGTGYVVTTGTLIQNAIAAWFNGFSIGQDSPLNKLWSPINLSGDAATNSSGLTQAQLDALSNTYNVTAIYQARADMIISGGPFAAGTNVIHVANAGTFYSIGQRIAVVLDNAAIFLTSITNIVGVAITMADNIPGGRSVEDDALVYVAGDIPMTFKEAAAGGAVTMEVN